MEISANLFLHYVQIRRPEAVWSTLLEAEDLEVETLGPLQKGTLLLPPSQWRGSRAE